MSRSEARRRTDRPTNDLREGRRPLLRAYELVTLPLLAFIVLEFARDPDPFMDWRTVCIAAITHRGPDAGPDGVVVRLQFSFPLELSVAILYPPPVAALIVFLGSADIREFRGQLAPLTALFVRSQIALAVLAESEVFRGLAHLRDGWFIVGPAVLLVAVVGYAVNTLLVAEWKALRRRVSLESILRQMHSGVLGEFVVRTWASPCSA